MVISDVIHNLEDNIKAKRSQSGEVENASVGFS